MIVVVLCLLLFVYSPMLPFGRIHTRQGMKYTERLDALLQHNQNMTWIFFSRICWVVQGTCRDQSWLPVLRLYALVNPRSSNSVRQHNVQGHISYSIPRSILTYWKPQGIVYTIGSTLSDGRRPGCCGCRFGISFSFTFLSFSIFLYTPYLSTIHQKDSDSTTSLIFIHHRYLPSTPTYKP